ncbi:unnamed protein product [Thelazia callipaeda]|uniref:G_PROTEIN_RECEP_F3_4 domain-containing protein n=1 Tax=Thelazia callipaeda TaxID=103827 RepID=A0A158RBG7_THECL|nr:unnamed protein product [Thelazia callipaeda]
MQIIDLFFQAVLLILFNKCHGLNPLCNIYDPFRIQPDDNKYQIGATFPLHEKDCLKLRVETVQDIVAVQWALTHWNQNSKTSQMKTGLYAGDTCSKPKEAISQTLKFLDSLNFYEPDECNTRNQNVRNLLGLILPKDALSAKSVASIFQTTPLPLLTYSYKAADVLAQMKFPYFATTAPTLDVFIDAFIRLMKNMNSNLVAIVSRNEDEILVNYIVEKLRQKNIFVSELINPKIAHFDQIIQESDSQIIFTPLSRSEIAKLLSGTSTGSDKTWVIIELDANEQRSGEESSQSSINSDTQIIYLRQQQRDLPHFKNYFLRVLKNNYQSYSLLNSLMQQMYNCTVGGENKDNDCSKVDLQTMALTYKQASTVESVIRAVYAFTAVAIKLEANPKISGKCKKPSVECTKLIMEEIGSLIYEFDSNDPAELIGTNLHFYLESNTTLISNGIVIEGIEVINDEKMNPREVKIMEYETGLKPRFAMTSPHRKPIHSACAPYRPYCGQCSYIANIDQKRFYLPDPRPHPLYITGLFNFHGGRSCQSYRNSDISLPLAFLHTMTTFSQRYSEITLLQNLEIGAVLIDSCSSARKALETVVLTENHCFTIERGGHNEYSGYASSLYGRVAETLKGLFASGDNLLISLDADHDIAFNAFSAIPSKKHETLALLLLLKKFSWEYISIVISNQESSLMSTYRLFEKLAMENGICIAEVKIVNGEEVDSLSTANVTILFTTASDAATYFASKFRKELHYPHVHIVIGDAHDFYLHDPSNIARFVGTISLQPKDVIYDEFRTWLEEATPLSLTEEWYWEYVENRWQCALSEANRHFYDGKMCTGDELLDIPSLGRMTKSGYLALGLERFLFALDAVYKQLCPEQNGVCEAFYVKGREQISKILKKAHIDDDFDIYEFLPDGQGSYSYKNIGNYSSKSGFKFSESYRYFDVLGNQISDEVSHLRIKSQCISSSCKCFTGMKSMQMSSSVFDESAAYAGSYIRRVPTNDAFHHIRSLSILDRLTAGRWRLQTWNYALAAIITVMVIGAIGVLLLAIIKLYLRVIKGNQSLGLSLLIGVIILYITGYGFVFEATDIVCRFRIILHPVGYAFCFAVIIAKATQLKNAESMGFSDDIHISYWNYWLLLFFITGVQIALSWLMIDFASVVIVEDEQPHLVCRYGNDEFLLSQSYVIMLLLLALYISSTSKNIKRNYKETKWLFISSLSCAVLWIMWITAFVLVPLPYKDTVIVVELLLCASVLLGFVFGPKIYIMLSYESVVVEMHPQHTMKDFVSDNEDSKQTCSPSSSVESRKSRTQSTCSVTNCKNLSASKRPDADDDQIPIFRTVMRKKTHLRRSQSADRQNLNRIIQQPSLPSKVIKCQYRKEGNGNYFPHTTHASRMSDIAKIC